MGDVRGRDGRDFIQRYLKLEDDVRRIRQVGTELEASYLNLEPYLTRMRYRDLGWVGFPQEYDWWGWFPNDQGGDIQNSFCGLVRYGNIVAGVGAIYCRGLPYQRDDPTRIVPSPLINGAVSVDWQSGGGSLDYWNSHSDNDRIEMGIDMIGGLWGGHRETYEQTGDVTRIPPAFAPYPTIVPFTLDTQAWASTETAVFNLEVMVHLDSDGFTYPTGVTQGGGGFCHPGPDYGGSLNNYCDDYRMPLPVDGIGYEGLYIDLEQIVFYVLPGNQGHTSGYDMTDYPFTE